MPLYVAEFQFCYNNRNNPDIFGIAIAGCEAQTPETVSARRKASGEPGNWNRTFGHAEDALRNHDGNPIET